LKKTKKLYEKHQKSFPEEVKVPDKLDTQEERKKKAKYGDEIKKSINLFQTNLIVSNQLNLNLRD